MWNGTEWSRAWVGHELLLSTLLALDGYGNIYAAAGDFTTAGANVSAYLAKGMLTGPTPNRLLLTKSDPSTNIIAFHGTPGDNYVLDLATDLAPPENWKPQMTNMASTNNATTSGYLLFTNVSFSPQGFYRTRDVP